MLFVQQKIAALQTLATQLHLLSERLYSVFEAFGLCCVRINRDGDVDARPETPRYTRSSPAATAAMDDLLLRSFSEKMRKVAFENLSGLPTVDTGAPRSTTV